MTRRSLSIEEAMAEAKQLTNAGKHSAAVKLYQKILEKNPQNKKISKALKALQKKNQGATRTARLHADMNKLMQLYSSGMYDQAYSHAAHLAKVYPDQPAPLNIMGVIQANRGDAKAAVTCYEQALTIAPNYGEATSNLGAALRTLKEYDRAIACFRRLIELDSENADGYYHLGNVLLDAGKTDDAIVAYDKSIAIRPLHSPSHFNLGRALESSGEPLKHAIASYRNAIDIDPQMVDAYLGIALAFLSLHKFDLSIAWFQDAMKLQPDHPGANRGLASALLQSGKREEAIAAYKHCLDLEPNSAEVLHFLNVAEDISPDMPPGKYVVNLFDSHAPQFEQILRGRLEYRGPEVLRQLVADSIAPDTRFARAIDLGCGTGLCGKAFEDVCDSLEGVDLSANMLQQAKQKNCYAHLHTGGIKETLEQLNTVFDLYICADTLVYMGELQSLFTTIGRHSTSGTLFTCSTELGSDHDFKLLETGRYSHSNDYIGRTAKNAGFSLVAFKEEGLRKSYGPWITGGFYLFRFAGNQ